MIALGLDGWRYLTTTDPSERLLLVALSERVPELVDRLQQAQAIHVVNTYAKAVR
jgi:hypothetical protein